MAKSSKKKKTQAVSIDGIYEILKEKKFTEDLWMDLLSDLKEKPTYKKIKGMVSSVITDKLQDYEQKPENNAERSKRRAALTEISILAYTIDRVISEVLYKRLENELKSLIANMLDEFQNKPSNHSQSVETKPTLEINAMLENIESIFTEKPRHGKDKVAKSPESSINELMSQKFGRSRGRPKKEQPEIVSAHKEEAKVDDPDDDHHSDNYSISSVGTDDLSSFDDSVSVCSDEGVEGRRKKKLIPVEKAKSMMVTGKLPRIYQMENKTDKTKKATEKTPIKILPQRKRKPNSKYNSETMYVNVKDYSSSTSSDKSEPVDDITTPAQQAKRLKSDGAEVKKKAATKKKSDTVEVKKEVEERKIPPINIVSTRSLSNSSSSSERSSGSETSESASPTKMQNTTKRYNPADLYKPRFHFGKS